MDESTTMQTTVDASTTETTTVAETTTETTTEMPTTTETTTEAPTTTEATTVDAQIQTQEGGPAAPVAPVAPAEQPAPAQTMESLLANARLDAVANHAADRALNGAPSTENSGEEEVVA